MYFKKPKINSQKQLILRFLELYYINHSRLYFSRSSKFDDKYHKALIDKGFLEYDRNKTFGLRYHSYWVSKKALLNYTTEGAKLLMVDRFMFCPDCGNLLDGNLSLNHKISFGHKKNCIIPHELKGVTDYEKQRRYARRRNLKQLNR